jgi:hypothetical protein
MLRITSSFKQTTRRGYPKTRVRAFARTLVFGLLFGEAAYGELIRAKTAAASTAVFAL